MPISKPHSTLGAGNMGSCSKLAVYLEKENKDLDKLLQTKTSLKDQRNIENRKQSFFSHSEKAISTNEVISSIDNNIKKLGRNDSKYFAPTISFSQKELDFIFDTVTNGEEVKDVWQLNQDQYRLYNDMIMDYTRLVMTNYAKNFNREDKGLKSGADLVYYAKIEHFRKFKGNDKEVISGKFKSGDIKPGLNTHVHVIVSRKSKSQRLKLTPTSKERKTDRSIGGNKYRVGFDRVRWINLNEDSFDKYFKYPRKALERFEIQNILKNGSPKEKEVLLKQINQQDLSTRNLQAKETKAKVSVPKNRIK
ncbi:DUF5712 family protein [Mesonia aestuariivivens]|uniref:Mobilization protein n=1 Tax=Mesonia aestuariivivens TaxID=2796128 RepID=A0ABS6W279_9FLAO|nr:DUF5712 family protein [Mesonia aestuariivivens]MBW2961955.1 hypothetical protein [Mesonia aestuariivivens]